MVNDVSPKEAFEMLEKDPATVILDVRSRVEFDYVGHPVGAVHVPWQEFPDWQADPDFVHNARLRLADARGTASPENDLTVLTICRSGGRSRAAAEALLDAGFRRVFNISEGFEGDRDAERHRGTRGGWRFHGLPWEQT
jgi:rhodanese-related sulfurtransferase